MSGLNKPSTKPPRQTWLKIHLRRLQRLRSHAALSCAPPPLQLGHWPLLPRAAEAAVHPHQLAQHHGPGPAIARPSADARPGTTPLRHQDHAGTTTATYAAVAYSTTFDLTENPISEGGRWFNTAVRSGPGANGERTGVWHQWSPNTYDDSYAYLSGFGPDQQAEAVVDVDLPFWAIPTKSSCFYDGLTPL